MRQALDKGLRTILEKTVVKARDIAETAANEALVRLGVGESSAPGYLKEDERKLRNKLRAHGRQLGDLLVGGKQQTTLLVHEMAYQYWHRMIFARFLEQSDLLMYDQHTPLTIEECHEIAPDEGAKDGWELAGRLAAKMLPQVFRAESPVFEVKLASNRIQDLEALIGKLDAKTFQASDALGWLYQFWQTKRKDEVNKSEVKIGSRELSPVTQLFTEPYMVSFLLDNALGAWWANKILTPDDLASVTTELELREKAAIPGVPLEYLRFVQADIDGEETDKYSDEKWTPAAGTFEHWPNHLSELKTLDPCCGSGHFLVATFLMLVPMRMQLEDLSATDAINKVLTENIHGLELDQRCVELAAFALALEAWRFPEAGGYRVLPELHIACSGLSISSAKEEWKQLAKGKEELTQALEWMQETFKDAPVLGSLIDPKKSKSSKQGDWKIIEKNLNQLLALSTSDESQEAKIVAQGMIKAASLLANDYNYVVTNVPYLARGKQVDRLRDFCDSNYPAGKNDLATVFLERCLELCVESGTSSIVLPQNWLFLTSYKKFREKLLTNDTLNILVRLGSGAFETISGEVVKAILITLTNVQSKQDHLLHSVDVSQKTDIVMKSDGLTLDKILCVEQGYSLLNPDYRIELQKNSLGSTLKEYSSFHNGMQTGDYLQYGRNFWELASNGNQWSFYQSSVNKSVDFGGGSGIVLWEGGKGRLQKSSSAVIRGTNAWGERGVSISATGEVVATSYRGVLYDENTVTILANEEDKLAAIYCCCKDENYNVEVRKINQTLKVRADLINIPFDLKLWTQVAEEKYPNGLPQPYSDDPTQWIFHGHPCGSVVWDEESKWTMNGPLRKDETVLHVAVARLLGYQWPAELDSDMDIADEVREWITANEKLTSYIDDDGIVCLPAVRGEKAAHDRLEDLLDAAYGDGWSANVLNDLLKSVNTESLDAWLRDKFFDQHSKLFQHRPFIWQIWDGEKDGFSALVNYHKFDLAGLERLIYTYLNDWIRTQENGVKETIDGADIRLTAARNLKQQLEAIVKGEASSTESGLDIFVRWKVLSEQPVGWNPDLNDGVRLNIRPFMQAKDVGKKGAGILRGKPNIHWKNDRGTDVESAPWFELGPEYGEKSGSRINDHHLSLEQKKLAREEAELEKVTNE
jgi:hypothetical protein